MGVFSDLFGTTAVIEKAVSGAANLADEAFYTREEEAADKRAATSEARGLLVRWLEATNPSRLARRVLAFAVTGAWLSLKGIAAALAVAAVWLEAYAAELMASVTIINQSAEDMGGAVLLVFGFYFAAPYMDGVARVALERFGISTGGIKR